MLQIFFYVLIQIFLINIHNVTSNRRKIYEVQKSWNTAFQASVQFKVKQKITKGWSLRFEFSGKLQRFDCWSGTVKNVDVSKQRSVYRVVNKAYNGKLKKGEIFKFNFNVWYPKGAINPKPPPVTIFFQNVLIYRSTEVAASSNPARTPTLPTTTENIVSVLNKYLSSRKQGTSSQNKDNSNNVFELLDNQFVERLTENDTFDNQNRINEYINRQNAETNRNNFISNGVNATKDNSTTEASIQEGSADVEINVALKNFTSKSNPRKTVPITNIPPIIVTSKYDYKVVIHKSLLFYEAQRSGSLPPNKRLEWTESSALSDRGRKGEDLTGGYYDAGDYVKFGFPMAYSVTMLAWSVIEYWDVYKHIGELQNVLDALKWGTDYFMKAHVSKYEFYGQVGDPTNEHKSWDRPESIPQKRPSFSITKSKPGSDLAGETAAALAAVSLAMRRASDGETTSYISELIQHANDLFVFGRNFRRRYDQSIKKAQDFYPSTSFKDELVWAAAWMYRATGEKEYLDWAEGQYQNWALFILPKHMKFSWDEKRVGVQVLLAQISSIFKKRYESTLTSYCDLLRSNKTYKTPKGLMFLGEWSPLRYAGNSAFVCLMAADLGLNGKENRLFFQRQIDYMLGDGGRSFLVGFGKNYPKSIHHRASSCPRKPQRCGWQSYKTNEPNPIVLEGALVGGPNQNDQFEDDRKNVKQSEVALDYNAGFQGAVAALQYQLMYPNQTISREDEPWYANYLKETAKKDAPIPRGAAVYIQVPLQYFLTWISLVIGIIMHSD